MPRRGMRSATVEPAHRRRSHSDRAAATSAGIRDVRASWASLEGLPIPLGATWIAEEEAWNFAVYSEHAHRVTLLLYAEADRVSPVLTNRLEDLKNKSGPIWHCRIPAAEMRGARFYAYQVEGPRSPHHPFDEDKILFDPYARALHFRPGFNRWAQWNGRFRDDVRRFVRGDAGMVPSLMRRLYGSDDLFPDDRASAYHAYQSVNYVTSHDGFTLADLLSYETKRNSANGHGNADGTDENLSWNCGWEGDTGVPTEVVALRRRQAKNFLTLLLLANGVPMLRAGDEFLHTQGGNNNPYNQDNETGWLDWSRLDAHRDVFRFARLMIGFRKAHPSLCRSRFWRHDVRWYGVGPSVDMSHGSHSFAYHLSGASQADHDLYVMVNAYWEPLQFVVQEGRPRQWQRVVDTGQESPDDIREPGRKVPLTSERYTAGPRSVVVLVRPRSSKG